ncbi:MAG: histidine ammonia-lyase [Acidobacteriia bacterium]|nr:histidine ammonia-lyase [Terriglobia bacterium]
MKTLHLTGHTLTLQEFCEVVNSSRAKVALHPKARARVMASRRLVESILKKGTAVYGVNTGFGKLSDRRIPASDIQQLQINLVRSHACGVGDPLSETEVRGIMLLRANVLAKGYSGVRPAVIELLCEMLNRRVHPVIPSKGSVGASGDLAPLAHLSQVMIGEGEAFHKGRRHNGHSALSHARLRPLHLEAKEGLALLNGTQVMLAIGLLSLVRAKVLADSADVVGALTLDALEGTPDAFDTKIQEARPHHGQAISAQNLRRLNAGSEIRESHRDARKDPRVQDVYSLRCMPQVHGAVRDTIDFVSNVFEIEMNSATDNPLVFPKTGEVISGGNFHGQPLAQALDFLAIAIAELGAISERRIERLVNPEFGDLPPFLTPHPGLNSGFMIAQVTAAALASENKVLAHPASVDSIPTSGNKEDHVSMGMGAALKLKQILTNCETILGIELLASAQGLDFLAPKQTGRLARRAYHSLRKAVPALGADRSLAPDIAVATQFIQTGTIAGVLSNPR